MSDALGDIIPKAKSLSEVWGSGLLEDQMKLDTDPSRILNVYCVIANIILRSI